MIRTFKHNILDFNTIGILSHLGLSPSMGAMYYQLLPEVKAIIETQVSVTAERLNKLLKGSYRKDMMDIYEYNMFPSYIEVMSAALSNPRNVGTYWDEKGLIQAKFVDLAALGDLGDLQRIQKTVHPGGTLQGWIGIYNSWLSGTSNKYVEIVSERIAIMRSEGSAPFVELIENGNGPAAYPRNEPKRTLLKFKSVYLREMKAAYLRILSIVRALTTRSAPLFYGYQIATISFGGRTYAGHMWTSPRSGSIIFAISGTTSITSLGRVVGRGFIIDAAGVVLRRWGGFLPM